MHIDKMFSTDFVCFYFKLEIRLRVQHRQAGWSGDQPDLPNAHLFPYMDVKGVCHAQP